MPNLIGYVERAPLPASCAPPAGAGRSARSTLVRWSALAVAVGILAATLYAQTAQTRPRARDLGVPFDGTPGPNNAITDVRGVEVGHTTLISGEGKLEVGKGPVRTLSLIHI